MVEFKLYVPDYQEEENLLSSLKEVGKKLGVSTQVIRFTDEEGDKLKLSIMIPVSVSKKIGIKQTQKTKSLYSQLLIFINNELFTFYPQKYGAKEITIETFLDELKKSNVVCLHESEEMKRELFGKRDK